MSYKIQIAFNLLYPDMTEDRAIELSKIIERAIEDSPTVVSDLLLPVVKEYEKKNFIPEGGMLPQDWEYKVTVSDIVGENSCDNYPEMY